MKVTLNLCSYMKNIFSLLRMSHQKPCKMKCHSVNLQKYVIGNIYNQKRLKFFGISLICVTKCKHWSYSFWIMGTLWLLYYLQESSKEKSKQILSNICFYLGCNRQIDGMDGGTFYSFPTEPKRYIFVDSCNMCVKSCSCPFSRILYWGIFVIPY